VLKTNGMLAALAAVQPEHELSNLKQIKPGRPEAN
jgi:hypothetical protein